MPLEYFWFLEYISEYPLIINFIPYACHCNPRFVYFLPHFWRPFLCFQGGFFTKFCPYVWLESGFQLRACYDGVGAVVITCHEFTLKYILLKLFLPKKQQQFIVLHLLKSNFPQPLVKHEVFVEFKPRKLEDEGKHAGWTFSLNCKGLPSFRMI